MEVYLKGAYGPGNLGDDVLLMCMISIIKNMLPNCKLIVGVENPKTAKKIDDSVKFLHYKQPCKVDILIFGGGGQFFDFKDDEIKSKEHFFNKLGNFVKFNRNPIWALKRIIYSQRKNCIDNLVIADNVALYAVGLGPFDEDGKGLKRLLKVCKSKNTFLSVRDNKSASFLADLGVSDFHIGADPSFIQESWFRKNKHFFSNKINRKEYDFSIVCREWPYTKEGRELIKASIKFGIDQIREGKNVRFVFLYDKYDISLAQKLRNYECLIYNPDSYTPSSFLEELVSTSKVVISSRAHGVWLPVLLGKPVIALGIENKLKQVHQSLVSSTLLVKNPEDLEKNTRIYVEKYNILQSNIKIDIEKNRHKSLNLLSEFREWLSETF